MHGGKKLTKYIHTFNNNELGFFTEVQAATDSEAYKVVLLLP
jgi:hypothetical protein